MSAMLAIPQCQGAVAFNSLCKSVKPSLHSSLRTSPMGLGGNFSFGRGKLALPVRRMVKPVLKTMASAAASTDGEFDFEKTATDVQAKIEQTATEVSEKLESTATEVQEKLVEKKIELKEKVEELLEKNSGYKWLIGPAIVTLFVAIPAATVNLALLFERTFFGGIAATFGLDLLFVLSADLFLLLTERFGLHSATGGLSAQRVDSGVAKGYPKLLRYVTYASIFTGVAALISAVLIQKLPAAVAVFGPYLGLLFAQEVNEVVFVRNKAAVFPLVPLLYVVYRFRQLNRGYALLPFIARGSPTLGNFVHVAAGLSALYLAMYLTQLPWLYSGWAAGKSSEKSSEKGPEKSSQANYSISTPSRR